MPEACTVMASLCTIAIPIPSVLSVCRARGVMLSLTSLVHGNVQGLGKTVSTIALIVRCHNRRRVQQQEKEKEKERRRGKALVPEDPGGLAQGPGLVRESSGATELADEKGAGDRGPHSGARTDGDGAQGAPSNAHSTAASAPGPASVSGAGPGSESRSGPASRGASSQGPEVVNLDEDEPLLVLDASQPVNRAPAFGVGPGGSFRGGGGGASSGAPRARPERGAGREGGKPPGGHSKRLPGGTLVVCPTSVLWQWEKELRAKLGPLCRDVSVLVYHGVNRGRKTAAELAEYGVVLTTYAIVALDVPRAEELRERAEEKEREREAMGGAGKAKTWKSKGQGSGADKQKAKRGAAAEGARGPLANIAWHRVVLDEAQCIKNRTTQVGLPPRSTRAW